MRTEIIDGEEFPIDEDYTTDKDGKPVEQDVTTMMERLDTTAYRHKVLCHNARSGRIGFWSKNRYIDSGVFNEVNRTDGWEVDFAKTRDDPGGKRGYCEIVRTDD